jgi:hypothetical protein
MDKTRAAYPPEFRRQMVDLVRAGRSPEGFRRNTAWPAASTPCSWKTRLAMSKPTVVISMVDGSFSSLHLTARAWHIDAVRGRPPHQIPSTSRA